MTVGDVLDGSFKLFKANARTLVLITAAVVVPVQVISAFVLRGQFDVGLLNVFRDPTIAESLAEEQQSGTQLLLTVLVSLISVLVTPFIAGAVARVVAASYLGREVGPGEALRVAARRFPALLGGFVLVHLVELPGYIVCILPGLALMAMFVLVAPAIAIEEIGPIAAMRRSWNLVRPRFWPVLGISLLAGFIANTLGQILGTLPALVAVFVGGTFAWLGVAVSGVLSQIVSLPIVTIAATLLYFDARISHEGFDLQIMASEIAAPPRTYGAWARMRPEELPPPTAPPDEIRRAADEILARPEFQQPPETLYERIMGAISDALDDLLSALFEGGRSSVVAWVALAVVVGVIALLVTRILTSMRANPPGSEAISVEAEPRRPAVDWDREADAHAAAGHWRDAVRCRYRALVARLAARGVVDEVPGRTAGEYRLEVGGKRPAAGPPFGEATEVFERAWYGHRDTGRDDYEALDALSGDVLARSAS